VADEILSRAGPTIVLVGGALCLVLSGGLLFGTLAAAFRGSAFDLAVRGWCHFATAAPSFWIALLALYVFSVELGWLPAGGVADVRAEDAGWLDPRHLVLPMLCLAVTQVSWFTLFVRTTVLEVLRDDHVQFARAQGLGERAVLVSHALRSALIPFVTLVGVHLSELIGGAVLIESVFAWPGLGLLTRDAALGVDLPLLVAITLGASVLVVVGNLLADVLYRALDPRVREAAA
jgi:peptide/nickel transport system permease protein